MSEKTKKGFVRLPMSNSMLKKGHEAKLIKMPTKDDIQSEQMAAMCEFGDFTFFDITGGELSLKDPGDAEMLLESAFRKPGEMLDNMMETFTDGKVTGKQLLQIRLMAGLGLITQTISAVRDGSHPIETLAYIKTFFDMVTTSMIVGVCKDINELTESGDKTTVKSTIDMLTNIIDEGPPSPVMMLHFIEACREGAGDKSGPGLHKVKLSEDDYTGLSEADCNDLNILKAKQVAANIKKNGGPDIDILELAEAIQQARVKGSSGMMINNNRGDNKDDETTPPTNKESRRDLN